MPHGFEDCKTCVNRTTHCKSVKVKNCRSVVQTDLLITYQKEKPLTEMFLQRIGEKA